MLNVVNSFMFILFSLISLQYFIFGLPALCGGRLRHPQLGKKVQLSVKGHALLAAAPEHPTLELGELGGKLVDARG